MTTKGNYPCDFCGKVFPTGCGKANHTRTHTGASALAGKKTSKSRIERGVAKGANNPNFGNKPRPWLEGENSSLARWNKEHPDFGDKQRGAANPIHKVKHLYDDPEYVARITSGLKAHVDKRRGSTYEAVYGVDKAAEYRKKLQDASPTRMAKFKRKETNPERILREILTELGLDFLQESPLGFYTVDFLLPEKRIVLQADGDYWHSNPLLFSKPSPIQRKRIRLDASCDSYLRNNGYRVLRFWESDLVQDPKGCSDKIAREIASV